MNNIKNTIVFSVFLNDFLFKKDFYKEIYFIKFSKLFLSHFLGKEDTEPSFHLANLLIMSAKQGFGWTAWVLTRPDLLLAWCGGFSVASMRACPGLIFHLPLA